MEKQQLPYVYYLLILACSQRKRPDAGFLPAIDRYDGVNFSVLHKARREGYLPKNFDILILSAKYGVIEAQTPIENYDLKMTKQRALELQVQASHDLDLHLSKINYAEIFVNLGQIYLMAIEHSEERKKLQEKMVYATGGIGQKMAQMKAWIHSIQKIAE